MIGKVTWQGTGGVSGPLNGAQSVTLEDGGGVTAVCEPEAADHFRLLLEIHRQEYSPAMGPRGVPVLYHFAGLVSGAVELEDKPGPDTTDGPPVY